MSFHVPVKALNPVDTKLPEHVVKGAVIVDEKISQWNPNVELDSGGPMSAFIVIDKKSGDVNEVIKRVVLDLKLPTNESYGLIFEEPKAFLTPTNLCRVNHGFMLTVTAAPSHYVERIHSTLLSRVDFDSVVWALTTLESFSSDPCFVSCFYVLSNIHLLYDLLADDRIESSQSCLSLCLSSLRSMFQLEVDGIGWSSASAPLVSKLATLVTGGAKSEDSNVVLIALRMIEQLLKSNSVAIVEHVLDEVPPQSLIRHLEKSDERVALAALSLMNALHEKSDAPSRLQLVKHLASVPFHTAVSGSVLREGRGRDEALLSQLVPLQRLLIEENTKLLGSTVTESDVEALLARDTIRSSASDETQLNDWSEQLLTTPLGKLAVDTFAKYADQNPDDLRILVSENSMRVSGAAWQLIPVWLHCISILCGLLGVVPNGEDCVESLIELLFRCGDSSFDQLFAVIVQLYHRTWREMHASHDEHDKVANVVQEQLRRAASNRPANLSVLEESLLALPYWKMKELWKRELTEKENNQLNSEVVNELRRLLRPSIEQLTRTNRKNILKQGYTFRRLVKGKAPHKGEDQFCFWKLDASDVLCLTETDVDPYVEGVSHAGNVRRVAAKDIASVDRGEDLTGRKSGAQSMRCIRVLLHDGGSISGATLSDRMLTTWLDGLTDLIGGDSLSRDATSTVDRLLNIELRLRLLDVPNPQLSIEVPPLPDDFSWAKPYVHDLDC